jgi:hypothetical protein
MYFDDANTLINAIIYKYEILEDKELMTVFKDSLVEKITDIVLEELSDGVSDAASDTLQKADNEDVSRYMEDISNQLEDMVWSELEGIADIKIEDYISNVDKQLGINSSNFNLLEMRYYLDIGQALGSILHEPDYDKNDYQGYNSTQSDDTLIIAMFER